EGATPSQRWPYSLQRNEASGPYWSVTRREPGSKRGESGGTEQSSSFVMKMIERKAFGRRKPAFSAGGFGLPLPSKLSARSGRRTEAKGASKPQPWSPSVAMQLNTVSMLPV